MIALLALAVFTGTEPKLDIASSSRSAHLMLVSSPAAAEVDPLPLGMSLPQLQREEQILDDPPSLFHPVIALAIGGALLLGGGAGLMGSTFLPAPTDALPSTGQVVVISSASIILSGLVLAMIGGCLLDRVLTVRRQYAVRKPMVKARIEALAADSRSPAPIDLAKVKSLEAEKPMLALPILLASSGAGAAVAGSIIYGTLGRGTDDSLRAVAIGSIVVGLAAHGLGIVQFISRLQTRAELDDQIGAVRATRDDATPAPSAAPAATALPSVPNQLAFGWQF